MISRSKKTMAKLLLYKTLMPVGVDSAGNDFPRSNIRYFEFTDLWVEEAG